MVLPTDALALVTHPDPYPLYRALAAATPFAFSPPLGMWVAAGARAVHAVLTSQLCHVRPKGEPVPRHLVGTEGGTLFARLARMRDDSGHAPLHAAVRARLDALGLPRVAAEARVQARMLLAARGDVDVAAEDATPFAFRLAARTVAAAMGIPAGALEQTAAWVGDWVSGLTPDAGADRVRAATEAARDLTALFAAHDACARRVERAEERDDGVANGIGLVMQAYEATAGLVGNTLVALGRERDEHARARVLVSDETLDALVRDVARRDPSVHNTRRFVVRGGEILGRAVQEGERVLVLLASESESESASASASGSESESARDISFGAGVHACPGSRLALVVAREGVRALLEAGARPERWSFAYRPSPNARVPFFSRRGEGEVTSDFVRRP